MREHTRKQRREARRNGNKYAKKDPGIPNSWPFKAQLIQQQQEQKVAAALANAAAREAKIRERQLARQADAAVQAAARLTAQQRRDLKRRDAAFSPLHDVLADADVVLIILDARDPTACRSLALESALLECGKLPVLLLNKCDLIPKASLDGWLAHLGAELPTLPFTCLRGGGEGRDSAAVSAAEEVVACLSSMLQQRRASLAEASDDPKGPKPSLSVGAIGFDRAGKRSVIRAIQAAAAGADDKLFDGVTLLTAPALLAPSIEAAKGVGLNDVLLRKAAIELVAQPELTVDSLLARCVKRSLLRAFECSSFEHSHEFLTDFAEANKLPEPRLLAGSTPGEFTKIIKEDKQKL